MEKSPSTVQFVNAEDTDSYKESASIKSTVNNGPDGLDPVKVRLEDDTPVPSSAASSAGDFVEVKNGDTASIDPWDIVEQADTTAKWSELTVPWKIWRVIWIFIRFCIILCMLYIFVCSLDVLQDAFQILGGRAAGTVFTSSFINNPVAGLMIGVLVTVLVQSSSTSTSIIVSMVGSGLLGVRQAIPIIMGANIGTTVTNTIVALTQSSDRNVFRRAFAGATVHDMFNWLTVLILLPLEVITGYLYYMTEAMVSDVHYSNNTDNPQFLKVITVPLTRLIIEVDKKVITAISLGTDRQKFPLPKYYCKEVTKKFLVNVTYGNESDAINADTFKYNVQQTNSSGYDQISYTEVLDANSTKCSHLFVGCGLPGATLGETAVGLILLIGALLVLVGCLLVMVKTLNSLLKGPMARLVRKAINADFPGVFAFLTGYVALFIGAGVTVLVQSSSVFTSALTPLVGIGVVTVERMYPLTLGSNIGTTVTSILAALTADANMVQYTLQISLCHLFFNISGILIWYPIPFMRKVPITLAKKLGNTTAKYRWFAVVYLILLYLFLPLVVFALSIPGWYVLLAVGGPIFILVIIVVIINMIQTRRPKWLPARLRTWDWLPRPLHSLQPYDYIITGCFRSAFCKKCCRCKCCREAAEQNETGSSSSQTSETVGKDYGMGLSGGSLPVYYVESEPKLACVEDSLRTGPAGELKGNINESYVEDADVHHCSQL